MNKNNVIILESAFSATPSIVKQNKDTLEFIAILQEADRKNRNGRIYYKKVLESGLESDYIKERLATRSLFVEMGHPLDSSIQRQTTIDVSRACALIEEIWWEGNLLKGKIETLNTSLGRDFKGIIEQGSRVAFSLRAQGKIHPDYSLGATIVDEPIQAITWDYVVNPSHDQAFLERICEETYNTMFTSKNFATPQMALCEAANLYDNGMVRTLNEEEVSKIEDFAKNYNKKVKSLNEVYSYDATDKVREIKDGIAILENEDKTKKVVLEDYILKDIRNKISSFDK